MPNLIGCRGAREGQWTWFVRYEVADRSKLGSGLRARPRWSLPLIAVTILVAALVGGGALGPSARADGLSTIYLSVIDAQDGSGIENFRWMVNLDNSHDDASIIAPASYSPVIATGDPDDAVIGITLPDTAPPDRGYLVTVLANDGVGELND